MVRKTSRTHPTTADGPSPASKAKSLRTLFHKELKVEKVTPAPELDPSWEDDLGPPLWEDDTMSLNSLLEEKEHTRRPCYKQSCGDHDHHQALDHSMTETSHSSYTSISMVHEENPLTKQKRRDRLEQMRTDRELVARLELQNLALEQETKKKSLNQSLNAFLTKPSKRKGSQQAKGELLKSTKTAVEAGATTKPGPSQDADRPSSPARPKVKPGMFMKTMSKLTLPKMEDGRKKHGSNHIGELPSISDHSNRTTSSRRQHTEGAVEAPTLCIKELSFEVGRGRKGTKTIKRHGGCEKARSVSPARPALPNPRKTTRSRTPVRTSSRVRRSPVATRKEIQW